MSFAIRSKNMFIVFYGFFFFFIELRLGLEAGESAGVENGKAAVSLPVGRAKKGWVTKGNLGLNGEVLFTNIIQRT